MKTKLLIFAALLLCLAFALLRFLWTWVIPGALVLTAVLWFTRKKKK